MPSRYRRALAVVVTLGALSPLALPVRAVDPPPPTFIHEVQGTGFSSPLAGQSVTVEGVVVGDFQGSANLGGFFLQEEAVDSDGMPTTSDGVFIADGSFGTDVAVGDVVRVAAVVTERFGQTQLGAVTQVSVIASGAEIPETALSLPLDNAEREAVEGMRVSLSDLYVTDTFNLHRFGEVWLSAGGVIETPTNELPPGAEMQSLAAANMLRVILLDDGSNASSPRPIPYLNREGTLRLGDRASHLAAVVGFSFSAYRLHPVEEVEFAALNLRPRAPDVEGNVRVASFNVLNYWTTIGCGRPCRGAQTPAQLEVQTTKLVAAIREMDADVIGLQELENDPSHLPIQTLVGALNAGDPGEQWAWVGPANHYNTYPIRNEIIYRVTEVTPIGSPIALSHPSFDAIGPSGDAFGRPPLAQTFEADGTTFTVVVNHFKSKSSPCGEPGEGLDGQGNCNMQRLLQADALLAFVAQLQATDPDVLVVGDFNSYMEEDPIHRLETELANLVSAADPDPYSYNFFAVASAPFIGRGSLDHAFATPTLAERATETQTWHINADEPRFLDWFAPELSGEGPYRSSDHDPLVVGLELPKDKDED